MAARSPEELEVESGEGLGAVEAEGVESSESGNCAGTAIASWFKRPIPSSQSNSCIV